MAKIKIFLPIRGLGARIEVDGNELRNVAQITVKARGGDMPEIWLQLIGDLDIEAESGIVGEVIHPKAGDDVKIIQGDPKK